MGNFIEAKEYYHEAIGYGDSFGDSTSLSFSYMGLALIACKKSNIPDAIENVKTGIENCPSFESGNSSNTEFILLYAGSVLTSLELFSESAMVLGAIEEKQSLILTNLPVCDQKIPEQITVSVKTALGDKLFSSAYTEGKEMGIEKVKDKVLEALEKITNP